MNYLRDSDASRADQLKGIDRRIAKACRKGKDCIYLATEIFTESVTKDLKDKGYVVSEGYGTGTTQISWRENYNGIR